MRTINIGDKTYVVQEYQMKRHGYILCRTPEDTIPWLIGYHDAANKALKK